MEEYEKRLIQKYSPSNLFKNKEETEETKEKLEIIEYKKDSLFGKLKKFIKKIFGIFRGKEETLKFQSFSFLIISDRIQERYK